MKTGFLARLLIRWLVCSLGLWIAAALLGGRIDYGSKMGVIIIAGLILAIANAIIKPLLILLSLPAVLLTLGLFIIVINGLMVLLVSALYPSLQVNGFGSAVLAGIVIGLVNYLVTAILESK
jgi:putative membrane protein